MPDCREKVRPCTSANFFQWGEFTISIGDTLHPAPLPLVFCLALSSPKHWSKDFGSAGAIYRAATSEAGMKPKRTILCVDDNEQALSIRKVMLETRGYRVIACTTGKDALEVFKQGGIDLVLSDLVMPDIDGANLVGKIKDISPETPAILFSGKIKIYDKDTR